MRIRILKIVQILLWLISVPFLVNAGDRGLDIGQISSMMDGKKLAVVFGVDNYRYKPLEAAVNDARSVSDRLKELGYEVHLYLNSEVTLSKLRYELGTYLSQSQPGDQVFVYFAGHGVTETLHDGSIEGYLLPHDYDIRSLYSTAFSMKELKELSNRIPARHVLYVLDACYSGLGLSRSVDGMKSNENRQAYMQELAGKRAVSIITAGKANEVAREVRGHGLFTLHLLDGMAGAADMDPVDNIIQSSELGVYVNQKVSKTTKNTQNPQFGLLEGGGDFLFVLNDADPIRHRQSLLEQLQYQSSELKERLSVQKDLNALMDSLHSSREEYRDEYQIKLDELDRAINEKQNEINQISLSLNNEEDLDTNRKRYSVMKFLNTGKEFDILKVFDSVAILDAYYRDIFQVDSEKTGTLAPRILKESMHYPDVYKKLRTLNKYRKKIASSVSDVKIKRSYHKTLPWLFPNGVIDKVNVKTFSPKTIFTNLHNIKSPLLNDSRVIVEYFQFIIDGIDSNSKLLTFDIVKERLIANYGQPTTVGEMRAVLNWKTGRETRLQQIWEDEYAKIVLSGSPLSCTGRSLMIEIFNKSKFRSAVLNQAKALYEAEQMIRLKQRIAKMADIEREKKAKAAKINF